MNFPPLFRGLEEGPDFSPKFPAIASTQAAMENDLPRDEFLKRKRAPIHLHNLRELVRCTAAGDNFT